MCTTQSLDTQARKTTLMHAAHPHVKGILPTFTIESSLFITKRKEFSNVSY